MPVLQPAIQSVFSTEPVATWADLSLSLGVATVYAGDAAVFTVTNPTPGVLRATTTGAASKELSSATRTARGYVWLNHPLTCRGAGFNGLDEIFHIEASHRASTANGIGVVAGFCSQADLSGGKWCGYASDRDGSGTSRVTSRSSDQINNVLASGASYRGGLGVQAGNKQSSVWSRVGYYTYAIATPSTRYTHDGRTAGSGQHINFDATPTLYPFIAFICTTNAGYVEVVGARVGRYTLPHIPPLV